MAAERDAASSGLPSGLRWTQSIGTGGHGGVGGGICWGVMTPRAIAVEKRIRYARSGGRRVAEMITLQPAFLMAWTKRVVES